MTATKNYKEKRHNPRLRTQLSAEIIAAEKSVTATITNLSCSGLQLECEQDLIDALMPDIKNPHPRQPLVINASFQFKKKGKRDAHIKLDCTIVYTRRLSQQRHILGCQFKIEGNESEKYLRSYLEHAPST